MLNDVIDDLIAEQKINKTKAPVLAKPVLAKPLPDIAEPIALAQPIIAAEEEPIAVAEVPIVEQVLAEAAAEAQPILAAEEHIAVEEGAVAPLVNQIEEKVDNIRVNAEEEQQAEQEMIAVIAGLPEAVKEIDPAVAAVLQELKEKIQQNNEKKTEETAIKLAEIEQLNNAHKEIITNLQSEIEQQQVQLKQLEEQLSDVPSPEQQEEITQLREQIATLNQTKITEEESLKAEFKKYIDELQLIYKQSYRAYDEEVQKTVDNMDKILAGINGQLEVEEAKITTLEEQIAANGVEKQGLEAEIQAKNAIKLTQEAALMQKDADIEKLRLEKDEQRVNGERIFGELRAKQDEIDRLYGINVLSVAQQEEITRLNQEIAALQEKEQLDFDEKIDLGIELDNRIREKEGLANDIRAVDKVIQRLNEKVQALNEGNEELDEQLTATQQEIAQYELLNKTLHDDNAEMHALLEQEQRLNDITGAALNEELVISRERFEELSQSKDVIKNLQEAIAALESNPKMRKEDFDKITELYRNVDKLKKDLENKDRIIKTYTGIAGTGTGVAGTGVAGTGVAGTGVAGTGVAGTGQLNVIQVPGVSNGSNNTKFTVEIVYPDPNSAENAMRVSGNDTTSTEGYLGALQNEKLARANPIASASLEEGSVLGSDVPSDINIRAPPGTSKYSVEELAEQKENDENLGKMIAERRVQERAQRRAQMETYGQPLVKERRVPVYPNVKGWKGGKKKFTRGSNKDKKNTTRKVKQYFNETDFIAF